MKPLLLTLLALILPLSAKEGAVGCGNLIYAGTRTSKCFSDEFLTTVQQKTSIATERRFKAVKLADDELFEIPFVIMTGEADFNLPVKERENLKKNLQNGGFLLASASCSNEAWSKSFEREIKSIFGNDSLKDIALDHEIFRTVFTIKELKLSHEGAPPTLKGIPTFASLASKVSETTRKETPLLAAETAAPAPARKSLVVAYFYKPGCQECIKAKQYINSLKTDFPLIELKEYNILDPSGLLLNQSLCAFLDAPSLKFSIAPSIFTQSGFVIGPDVSPASLGKLFAETMEAPQDDTWIEITDSAPVQEVAAQEVDRRYESITLPIVLLGGLLDGINPCAFATIIFFLSYLQIARRTPREMLMVGAAFISAVFIAYLAAGLLLHEVIASLNEHFAGIQRWMNLVFGILALIAAYLSLRDALRARAGRLDEMTLQLPGILKDRIRGVIRSGARARNFVIAAFLSGLVISLLELACTGQVYAPIIYQIQKGRLDAVLWLVVYNLAFITPLIVIFLLAYGGLRSETLVAFQKKHTFSVKLGLALLFLFLALFILFGSKFLPH